MFTALETITPHSRAVASESRERSELHKRRRDIGIVPAAGGGYMRPRQNSPFSPRLVVYKKEEAVKIDDRLQKEKRSSCAQWLAEIPTSTYIALL